MTDVAEISTLRRKLGATRPASEPEGTSPAGLLRKAVAKAGEDLHGLVAAVTGFGESRAGLGDIMEGLPEPALLMSLVSRDGRRGLAVADVQLVTALVEHLTTGRIVQGEAASRRPTRTDAVMVSDFLDRFLAEFDEGLAGLAAASPVSGFRYGALFAEPRMAQMSLAEVSYGVYRLRIDLGRGARTGEITLAFPASRAPEPVAGAGSAAEWNKELAACVMEAKATLWAVLHRFNVPLSAISHWKPGVLLEIPMESVTAVELEGLDGCVVATGKLGHVAADRAVRLLTTGTPSAGGSRSGVAARGKGGREQVPVTSPDGGNVLVEDRPATEK
jgi:flagellar motor switch protein FliM